MFDHLFPGIESGQPFWLRYVASVTKRNSKGLYALRLNPAKLRVGVHRLSVTVVFKPGTGTKPRTFRSAFQRCAKQLLAPRFTG